MNQKIPTALLILALFISAVATLQNVDLASANPDSTYPALSMPVEYVNYTITHINGTLWAKIDGNYPINVQKQQNCVFNELPMVYPLPPGTTNIHVWLGNQELSWLNYTEAYPDQLHHTAVGDWWMIYAVLPDVSGSFVLRIHYEHPLAAVNGSYLFLYDLNINPYLSEQGNTNSTCYFTVRMDANVTNVRAYTTKTDTQWNPIAFTTTKEGSVSVVSIPEHSEYGKVLGDLVVEFDDADQVPEFPLWAVPVLVAAILLLALLYLKRKALVFPARLSKTAISANT